VKNKKSAKKIKIELKMSKNENHKVVIIGLDGASFNYLNPFIKMGLMPNVERLIKEGSSGILKSTLPPVTAPAWTSFITGKNPGKHGILSFFHKKNRKPTNYVDEEFLWDNSTKTLNENRIINANDIKYCLWDVLSKNNKKSIIINVPITYPAKKINGVLISGMLTPSKETNWTYPKNLKEKLDSGYVIDLLDYFWGGREYKLINLLLDIKEMTEKRADVALKLMKEEQWDFFFLVFVGPDRICHMAWRFLRDDYKPKNENEKTILKILKNYFNELDSFIGKIVKNVGKESTIFLVSDHGFQDSPKKLILLKNISKLQENFEMINLHHSRFIGLNKIPDKNIKYKELVYRIKNIKELRGNIKLHKRENLYHGEKLTDLPDFILESAPPYGFTNSNLESTSPIIDGNFSIGEHSKDGIWISSDPVFKKTRKYTKTEIIDIFPTILELLNIKIPDGTDGISLFKERKKLILDVGCGQGANIERLNKKGEVMGIDISKNSIDIAKKNFPDNKFYVMSAENLGFKDKYFDEIHCYDVLEHVDEIHDTLSEISRVIKKTGRLIIEVPYQPSEKFLARLNPNYFEQSHHRRVFEKERIVSLLNRYTFEVEKISGKKFHDNLYLGYAFFKDYKVVSQLGELDTPGKKDEYDKINSCLLLLNAKSIEETRKIMGNDAIRTIENYMGMPIADITVFIKTLNEIGSRLFPKTIRLECIHDVNAKNNPNDFLIVNENPEVLTNFKNLVGKVTNKVLKENLEEKDRVIEEKDRGIEEKDRVINEKDKVIKNLENSKALRFARKIDEIKRRVM